jgi:signal transduction histidine kinase
MKTPSDQELCLGHMNDKDLRDRLIGLGDRSMRKTYYPELRRRLGEVERSKETLQTLMDAMPSMLACVDLDLRLTLVNSQFAQTVDMSPSDLIGKRIENIIPWLPRIKYIVDEIQRGHEPRSYRKMPRSGAERCDWYDVVAFPLGQSEVALRIDNVTSRVRMENMLVQTEKMLSVGALAAGMAHEVNNPLAGILLSVQSILRRCEIDFEPNKTVSLRVGADLVAMNAYMEERGILGMLHSILEAGLRASRITKNLLDFSRRSEMDKDNAFLSDVVDKALELAMSEFDLKKI